MTASALKTFRRNWIHRGGNDFRKIIALANMSFRTGTPYPSMPVLGNVVLMPYPPGLRFAHPGLSDSFRPYRASLSINPGLFGRLDLCFFYV